MSAVENLDRKPGAVAPSNVAAQTPESSSVHDEKVEDKLEHLGEQTKTPG